MTAPLTTQEREEVEAELADLREDLAGVNQAEPLPGAEHRQVAFRESTLREIERLEGMLTDD